ncbi:MAG: hypothetical protein H6662_17330 [Ardenticatenaceae bacterium]|nr:hypothetical protein [Anaerolineales bacterium]MCB8923353.1 hypothetical protein [Ardenticatenaceae bacterium]
MQDVQLITNLRKNMKNRPLSLMDKHFYTSKPLLRQ